MLQLYYVGANTICEFIHMTIFYHNEFYLKDSFIFVRTNLDPGYHKEQIAVGET